MKSKAYSYPDCSPVLHRWDPRLRLIGLAVLVLAFSLVNEASLLPLMLVLTLVILVLSKMGLGLLIKRLRYPSLVILFLVLTLPFISGEHEILRIGFLSLTQDGLWAAVLITVRFFCILATAMAVLHTASLFTHVQAMQALGMPWVMADMALLAVRYLEVLGADLRRMQTAMNLRGVNPRRFRLDQLRTWAWLCGSLLLRSLQRADWVYRAMRLRGYGQIQNAPRDFQVQSQDILLLLMTVVAAGSIAGLQIWLKQ